MKIRQYFEKMMMKIWHPFQGATKTLLEENVQLQMYMLENKNGWKNQCLKYPFQEVGKRSEK